ncbi:MAG: anti-sigma factor [Actinomycetota bacterium]|nr:anti-sigma factor [Actinomycetota bacterium]
MSILTERLRFRRDHRWTPQHVSPYLDDELARRARARLQRHVAECPECRGVLRSLERMLLRLGGVPSPAASEAPDLAERIRARLRDSGVD